MAAPNPDQALVRPADPDENPTMYADGRDPRVVRTTLMAPISLLWFQTDRSVYNLPQEIQYP